MCQHFSSDLPGCRLGSQPPLFKPLQLLAALTGELVLAHAIQPLEFLEVSRGMVWRRFQMGTGDRGQGFSLELMSRL